MQLDIPYRKDQIGFPILVGLDHSATVAAIAHGQPVTRPKLCHAVIDTGSETTAVDPSVIPALGIRSQSVASSQTASGTVWVNLYSVSVSLLPIFGLTQAVVLDTALIVSELTTSIPNIDVLFGLDLLHHCKLVIDGPKRTYTLHV
jgi:hypothetical protein